MSKKCALPKSVFPLKFKVKSPVQALELAKSLIRPFKHWVIGALALDHKGIESVTTGGMEPVSVEVKPKSPRAEAFCALGALLRVNTKHAKAAEKFLAEAAARINRDYDPAKANNPNAAAPSRQDIFAVNDDMGRDEAAHKKVLEMFTLAIKLAKAAATSKGAK